MFYNLKFIIRNLRRNGVYSVVNITGLSVSLAAAILILLWVNDEMNYDRFHTKGENIYQTMVSFSLGGREIAYKTTSPPLGQFSKEEIPDIVSFCRIVEPGRTTFRYEERETAVINRFHVDSSFFSMFSFRLLTGDPTNPFPDPDAVILSKTTAESLFGNYGDAFGKIIQQDKNSFHVSGVMEDLKDNTQFQCDALCSAEIFRQKEFYTHWGSLGTRTFFQLHPGADYREVSQRITDVHNKNFPEFAMTYTLQPLFKSRFYDEKNQPNANMQACKLFSLAVLVLLIIASINYVNLVTARIAKRNKELFVRRVLGAGKWRIFFQSMQESTVLLLLAMIAATYLWTSLFSLFKDISGKEMELNVLSPQTLMVYGITFVAVTVFASLYPAINLMMFQSVELPGRSKHKRGSGVWLRRVLVTLQFGAAIMLVTSSIVISLQMSFMQKKNLGYDRENVLEIPMRSNLLSSRDAIKNELSQQAGVLGVSIASVQIHNVQRAGGWKDSLMMAFVDVDKAFIPTMGMELVAGSNFSDSPADSAHFILNETAVKTIGITDPVGKPFEFLDVHGTIIGVVKDFNFRNLHEKIDPLLFRYTNEIRLMYVRLAPATVHQTVPEIEKIIRRYDSETAFTYTFLDERIDNMYHSDSRTGKLFNIFAVIAIIVSCLGLFGLVTFTAESKTKEIGIRKVLGASVMQIIQLLLKEFLILVGVAMLVAFPLAYFWLDGLLQDYAYRIQISWQVFALAGLITILMTLITVSWLAVKAATANPVNAIKSE